MKKLLVLIFVMLPWHCFSADIKNKYIEAGIPIPNRVWYGPDYMQTYNVLSSGNVGLPHMSDPDGALLIKRITSLDNLTSYKNTTLSIHARIADFGQLLNGSALILKIYINATSNTGEILHEEMAQLMAFELHVMASAMQLVKENIPTIPKDEKYEVRMNGVKQMYSGATTVFTGAEASLSNKSYFTEDELSQLLASMADCLPQIKQAFPLGYKDELKIKLKMRTVEFKRERDLKNINKMLDELNV